MLSITLKAIVPTVCAYIKCLLRSWRLSALAVHTDYHYCSVQSCTLFTTFYFLDQRNILRTLHYKTNYVFSFSKWFKGINETTFEVTMFTKSLPAGFPYDMPPTPADLLTVSTFRVVTVLPSGKKQSGIGVIRNQSA